MGLSLQQLVAALLRLFCCIMRSRFSMVEEAVVTEEAFLHCVNWWARQLVQKRKLVIALQPANPVASVLHVHSQFLCAAAVHLAAAEFSAAIG